MLNREAILAAQDLKIEKVEIPEWGGEVCVKTLSGKERDHFEQAVQDANQDGKIELRGLKVRLVALALCDEQGEPLFTVDHCEELNAKSSKAIDRIFQVAQRLNGLTAETIEELAGN